MGFNFSLTVAVPTFRPYIYVDKDNNKIYTKVAVPNLSKLFYPKNTKYIEVNSYELGTLNKSGHYDGLLGFLQRREVDTIFYYTPIDIKNPPGIFSHVSYDSGIGALSYVEFPKIRSRDLINCFSDFKLDVIYTSLIFFLLIITLIFLLSSKISLSNTIFFVYRIMVKEHRLEIRKEKVRFFILFVLLYYFMINLLVEQNLNIKMVITDSPIYFDDIDTIYSDNSYIPHFIEEHFTIGFFKNSDDKRLNNIVDRSLKKCSRCTHNFRKLFSVWHMNGQKYLEKTKEFFIFEHVLQLMFKKAICYSNYEWIVKKGVIRIGSFYFRQLQSFIFIETINKIYKREFDIKILYLQNNGISRYIYDKVLDADWGIFKIQNSLHRICLDRNEVSSLSKSFDSIKLQNIYYLILTMLVFYLTLVSIFILFQFFNTSKQIKFSQKYK